MRPMLAAALAALSLAAQTPRLDETFFQGERKLILKELADRLKTQKGDDAKIMAECGRAYLGALQPSLGKSTLQAAENREPEDGEVLRLVALAWLKNGHKSEAMEAYALVERRDPKNKSALAQCGADLAEVGLMAEADRFMKTVAILEPDGWKYFLQFGRACLIGGQRKAAARWFSRAVDVKPKEEKVLLEILRAFTETQVVF